MKTYVGGNLGSHVHELGTDTLAGGHDVAVLVAHVVVRHLRLGACEHARNGTTQVIVHVEKQPNIHQMHWTVHDILG